MKICKIEGCSKNVWWRGYCSQHGQRLKFHGDPLYLKFEQHGMRNTTEYRSWSHMKDRCYREKDKRYSSYGGRGITVCDEWRNSFTAFYKDMGKKPSPKHSLDRIDNNGNYEPSNCRWATNVQQASNRRSSRLFTYDGRTMNIKEWSDSSGIAYNTLRQRLMRYNWPIEKALKGATCHSQWKERSTYPSMAGMVVV